MAKGEKKISRFPSIGSYLSESGYHIRLLANAENSDYGGDSAYIHTGTVDAGYLISHYTSGGGGDVGQYLATRGTYTGGDYSSEGERTRIFISPATPSDNNSYYWAYASNYVPELMSAYLGRLPEYPIPPEDEDEEPDDIYDGYAQYFFVRDGSASNYSWKLAETYLNEYVRDNAYYIYEMISNYLD